MTALCRTAHCPYTTGVSYCAALLQFGYRVGAYSDGCIVSVVFHYTVLETLFASGSYHTGRAVIPAAGSQTDNKNPKLHSASDSRYFLYFLMSLGFFLFWCIVSFFADLTKHTVIKANQTLNRLPGFCSWDRILICYCCCVVDCVFGLREQL